MSILSILNNDNGVIILAATKTMFTEDSVVVETSTMLWALQLANSRHFQICIIEGDANIYIDACIGK